VPRDVAVLTRSVDVQGDRIETAVYGWGPETECWPIEHEVIPGDPKLLENQPNSPWRELAWDRDGAIVHRTRSASR
jgi:phage terminase large subunit GpA-like protein